MCTQVIYELCQFGDNIYRAAQTTHILQVVYAGARVPYSQTLSDIEAGKKAYVRIEVAHKHALIQTNNIHNTCAICAQSGVQSTHFTFPLEAVYSALGKFQIALAHLARAFVRDQLITITQS